MFGGFLRTRRQSETEVPSAVKRCNRCRQTFPLSSFHARPKGGQGVAGQCRECLEIRYQTENFKCNRCQEQKAGIEFFRGGAGSSCIMQPCKKCKSAAGTEKTRIRQIEEGRSPYHLLSAINTEKKTATCRECGPTHIYATGAKTGRGWRCGTRSDQLSATWYDTKAKIVNKHASKRWHKLQEINGTTMRGNCSQCGDTPVRWNQSESRFVCASPKRKEHHAKNQRKRNRLGKYGLTPEDYERMNVEQAGRCAICGGTSARSDSQAGLVVDHDHKTGKVRQLLCNLCNTGIGQLREDPEILTAAIEYLKKHAEQ